MLTPRPAALALLGLALAWLPAAADDLTTLTGKRLTGKFVSVDAKGVVFHTDAGDVPVAAKELSAIDLGNKVAPPADAKYDEVELTDGSVFRCAKFAIK